MGLLYPNTTYIHSSHLTDDEWLMVRDSGGNVSLAPQIELQMGHGWAPAQTADRLGIPVGLSSDVATTASSDQFTQMHAIFVVRARAPAPGGVGRGPRRQLADAGPHHRRATSSAGRRSTARRSPGIADWTGSITPGKKADLVIIDGSAVNVAPVIDPVGAVVCAADISNVDTVFVDGGILKQDGKLVAALDGPRRDILASRDYLVEKFGDPEPGWLVGATA